MINSWAADAHAMINKNADYRAGAARRTARAMTRARYTLWGRHRRAVGAAAPRCKACAGLTLGLVLCLTLGRQAARGCVDQAKTVADALLRYRQKGV